MSASRSDSNTDGDRWRRMRPRLTLIRQTGARRVLEYEDVRDGESVFLDREFLLDDPNDVRAPRRSHAPEIFHARGELLLYNRSDVDAIALTYPSGLATRLAPQTLRWIARGISFIDAYGVAVRVVVSGDGDHVEPSLVAGPVTLTDGPRVLSAVEAIIGRDERLRTILVTRFQMYLTTVRNPRHLTAAETVACYPAASIQDVNNLQARIRYHTGLDLPDVGPFLRDNGIITHVDVLDLTHPGCDHNWL